MKTGEELKRANFWLLFAIILLAIILVASYMLSVALRVHYSPKLSRPTPQPAATAPGA